MLFRSYDVKDLEEIAALVESGAIRPHIAKVLPLEQARQAMDLNQQGKSHGKIVLEVGSDQPRTAKTASTSTATP